MAYKKINLELIVFDEEADAVIAELNSALDRLEERHTIFGGEFESVPVEQSGRKRKSALDHTLAAGGTAAGAVKSAGEKVTDALRRII